VNIIVYSIMCYAITAAIAFGVIGVVVILARVFSRRGDAEAQ